MEDNSENPGADARRKYEDSEFIAAVQEHDLATTSEIAEAVGCPRRSADYRLRQLEKCGELDVKKTGGILIWFLPEA